MTKDEAKRVDFRIDQEGFDYCFRAYSDFKDINDPEFHRLKEEYIFAADQLEEFIQKHLK